ncbi:ATP-binding protein [Bdellovibrio reynosensis]|uniref:histidine kinase n=1 Tax=Bdellovibrio reynosensis TaxID=2835041 RepID=A0ABY4CD35_9BACT|nr:ATP-binding protein [Bdellovibrio reynosensis]UOF01772.1 ATP-binding protein [Bdellovibrio reynosensis]
MGQKVSHKLHFEKTATKISFGFALFITLIGILVLIGWQINSVDLLTAWDRGAVMNERTALGLFFTGFGIFFYLFYFPRLSQACGYIIGLIAFTGVRFFQINAWWDQRVGPYFKSPETLNIESYLSPYTRTCFFFIAVALIAPFTSDFRKKSMIFGLFGPAVIAIPVAALIANYYDLGPTADVGLNAMAFHTAVTLIAAGISLTYLEFESNKANIKQWWPVILGLCTFIITLIVWQAYVVRLPEDDFLSTLILVVGTAVSLVLSFMGYLIQTLMKSLKVSKTTEAQLKELNETLEERVAEKTRELAQRLIELDKFSAIAAHDLRSPVASMISYSELIMDETSKEQPAHQYAETIHRLGTKAVKLIEVLLEYARSGTVSSKPVELDTNHIVDLAITNLQSEIAGKEANVEVAPLPHVCGDEILLIELFQNLIGNSLKYSKPGVHPEIKIQCEQNENMNQFKISDNGIGIDPAYSEKIFGLFERAKEVSEKTEGSGVGLAVCKKIVEGYGGKIWFESKLGFGTSFIFTLPLVKNTPCSATSPVK